MADVIVISDTIQEFQGERFYKCGNYFQHKGKRLHRAVWMANNGEIPKGYAVHHKDKDTANNNLENLVLMSEEEHIKLHSCDANRSENGKKAIKLAQEAAKAWHSSEEGRRWHSEHIKQTLANRKPTKYICSFCGCEYESMSVKKSGNHFCCNNHKAAFRRKRTKDESSSD